MRSFFAIDSLIYLLEIKDNGMFELRNILKKSDRIIGTKETIFKHIKKHKGKRISEETVKEILLEIVCRGK